MKKLLLLPFCLLCLVSSAQDLVHSRHTSFYTYIFKLTDAEAQQVFQKDLSVVTEDFFHTTLDSFPTAKNYSKPLPLGHYLFTHTEENELIFEFHSIGLLQVKLLNNKNDLAIHLHDSLGRQVTTAQVFVKHKQIPFHTPTQSYRLRNSNQRGLLAVTYQGFTAYHVLAADHKHSKTKQLVKQVAFSRPGLGYVTLPFYQIYASIRYHRPQGWIERVAHLFENDGWKKTFSADYHYYRVKNRYKSLMVFSKPRYMPHDTVKLKAAIQKTKGAYARKNLSLQVWLSSYSTTGNQKKIQLDTLTSYRKGFYEYSFVLADSLKISIGTVCTVSLEDNKSGVYASATFKYEDYELKSNTFAIRSDKQAYLYGNKPILYAKGTDENNLPVPDARVRLTLLPVHVSRFPDKQVVVPDTLWTHEQVLKASGETTISIPDSVFPLANLECRLQAVFLNTSNESHTKQLKFSYYYHTEELKLSLHGDTLVAEYLKNQQSAPATATLVAYADEDQEQEILHKTVSLPYHEPVNPYVRSYELNVNKLWKDLELQSQSAQFAVNTLRTADSVWVQIVNPLHLPYWYTIYRKNAQLGAGFSQQDLNFQRKATISQKYFVSVQYIWNNQIHAEEYVIPLATKQLQIQTSEPIVVSPGQTIPIRVDVRDIHGKPVPNADITAYAATRKFPELSQPSVRDFSKQYANRRVINTFHLKHRVVEDGLKDEYSEDKTKDRQKLQWERWHTEMGLDTLAYYQFLYPKTGLYKHYLPMPNLMTQIAPFVVVNGQIEPIHLFFIDEEPVYFQVSSDERQRYSFHADAGYHKLQIRTQTLNITLDSVYLKPHHKLILSIDPESFYTPEKIQKNTILTTRKATPNLQAFTHIDTTFAILTPQEVAMRNAHLMSVHRNFSYNDYVYLSQDKRIFMLNQRSYSHQPTVIGPVKPTQAELVSKNSFSTQFLFQPGFTYEFNPQLLTQRTWQDYPSALLFYTGKIQPNFSERAWTSYEIDSLNNSYKNKPSEPEEYYNNPYVTTAGNGRVELQLPDTKMPAIQYLVLYNEHQPDSIRIFPARDRDLHQLRPGSYRLVVLFDKNAYLTVSHIQVCKNAVTYYQTSAADLIHKADAYSQQLVQQVKEKLKPIPIVVETVTMPEYGDASQRKPPVFKSSQQPSGKFTQHVKGRVLDETGTPLPGVSVYVKGTSVGILTDADGFYSFYAPSNGTLVISFIGYLAKEVPIGGNTYVQLTADTHSLQEVVIVGYGEQKKSSITGAISSISSELQGKAAGVVVRGTSSISTPQPLYVINGILYEGADIDPSIITSIAVMIDAAAATAIYGAKAANGVIIITTKDGIYTPSPTAKRIDLPVELPQEASHTIRSRFSDEAFWHPRLRTDKHGQATFQATFPDDITNWQMYVVAMGSRKRSGVSRSQIKAFKTVAGTLAVPRFLVQGDTTQVIGKALNYTSDTLNLQTSFEVNGHKLPPHTHAVRDAYIDSLRVTTDAKLDSVKIIYQVRKSATYSDGEQRSIPVVAQGVTETKGHFLVLEKDTTTTLSFNPASGKIHVYARANVLDILQDEIAHVHRYEYLCNEQLASKIKAYLAAQRIAQQLNQPFAYDQDIRKMIHKLEETRLPNGTWSWWKGGPTALWITVHATEALLQAQQAGYDISLKPQTLTNALVYDLEKGSLDDRIRRLTLLKQLGASIAYPKYIATLDSLFKPVKKTTVRNQLGYVQTIGGPSHTFAEWLQLLELKQTLAMPVKLDTIFKTQQKTMFGNSYWGETAYHPYLNETQTTLLVYQILKQQGGYAQELASIRNYFLEKRRSGYWRNTYESTQILETILPDILGTAMSVQPAKLILQNGLQTQAIDTFPFEAELPATTQLTIQKTGTLPVYCTAYQQFQNTHPEKVEKDFQVTTRFTGEKSTQKILKAGESVMLQVTVAVQKHADYVQVEVPIPAGCSYGEESASRNRYIGYETHREQFRHKTTIYCTQLNKGTYTFTIPLTARYTGTYTLNPAKAELMYFPTFFGRNEMQQVQVK